MNYSRCSSCYNPLRVMEIEIEGKIVVYCRKCCPLPDGIFKDTKDVYFLSTIPPPLKEKEKEKQE